MDLCIQSLSIYGAEKISKEGELKKTILLVEDLLHKIEEDRIRIDALEREKIEWKERSMRCKDKNQKLMNTVRRLVRSETSLSTWNDRMRKDIADQDQTIQQFRAENQILQERIAS